VPAGAELARAGGEVSPPGGKNVTGQDHQVPDPELALRLSDAQAADVEIAGYYAAHREKVRRFLIGGRGCLRLMPRTSSRT
jgi:hypothetical protein